MGCLGPELGRNVNLCMWNRERVVGVEGESVVLAKHGNATGVGQKEIRNRHKRQLGDGVGSK